MSVCLIAEYETKAAAKVALEVLESDGFTLDSVSVVSNADDPAAEHLQELHDESSSEESSASAPEGRSTSLGMLIGGTVAAPIAAGTMVGPFIIAGPLVGMALGAAIGGLAGSMSRWGVDDDLSADYQSRVQSGSLLVIVHDVDEMRLADANRLLKTTDPKSLEQYQAS